ncbi:MAG: ABC transporter substrate-binding protein [Hyphomicrobium sp.]|jgi:NitT/TauT family transport system substrate-binding protein
MIDRRRFVRGSGGALVSASLASVSVPHVAWAADAPLRIATVKFGSLSWVLETIKVEGLDKKSGLTLEIVEVPSNQAGPVALLSNGADVIVSDWTWAMRQRAVGEKLKFSPYSSALGAVVVPEQSAIKTLADLEGKSLGVAGSNIDKSWLLLRAYSKKKLGRDIAEIANTSYGAAPLLAEEIRSGRIDAVLNFWTFTARLEGSGFRSILTVADIMKDLGVDPVPSLVGFIWKEGYEALNASKVHTLLAIVDEANQILLTSDMAWDRLRPLVKPGSDAEMKSIMVHYRAGIPKTWGADQMKSAEKLMQILVGAGDAELMGHDTSFDARLFRNAAS